MWTTVRQVVGLASDGSRWPGCSPAPQHPGLLAPVHITQRAGPRAVHGADLYGSIWRRHSNRLPFPDERLPGSVLRELAEAAHTEGATLIVPRTTRDGTAVAGHCRRGAPQSRRRGPQRGKPPVGEPGRVREHRRTDWLRAGQALQHVLLVATAHRLHTSLLHQALEWPGLRNDLRSATAPFDHVQMLIRLGYGPEGPATHRRMPPLFLNLDGTAASDDRTAPSSGRTGHGRGTCIRTAQTGPEAVGPPLWK